MDIARPDLLEKKRKRQLAWTVVVIGGHRRRTVGARGSSRPAPTVERATLVIDTVTRGEMVRRGARLGTLVPEEIRWIPAVTDARVERRVLLPGTKVNARIGDPRAQQPQLEMQALDAESQARARRGALRQLGCSSRASPSTRRPAPRLEAQYEQARLRAEADRELARTGCSEIDR